MNLRSLMLGVALLFTVALAALTLRVLLQHGIDVLVVLSLVVLSLFMFGIVGALLHPPDE
jgi:hypothetical protein